MGDEADVLTRVGDEQALEREWNLSTDGQATFFPDNDIVFIKQLLEVDRLVAQVTPFLESPVTLVLDLTGLNNAIKPLREACGW